MPYPFRQHQLAKRFKNYEAYSSLQQLPEGFVVSPLDSVEGIIREPSDPLSLVVIADNAIYFHEDNWTRIPYNGIAEIGSDETKCGPPFRFFIRFKAGEYREYLSSQAYALHSMLMRLIED